VGEPIAEFRQAVELARGHYLADMPGDVDAVVTNAYAKLNEPGLALWSAMRLLGEGDGTVVLTSDNPYGSVPHYVYGRFGHHTGGRLWGPSRPRVVDKTVIVHLPSADRSTLQVVASVEGALLASTWPDAVALLAAAHPDGARVAVVPDGTIQYFG